MGKRIEKWARLIFALETTETVANYATLAAGVGVVAFVASQGGKWAVG